VTIATYTLNASHLIANLDIQTKELANQGDDNLFSCILLPNMLLQMMLDETTAKRQPKIIYTR
jgi:hypothetical protein